jgi:hypothetical protein
MPFGHDALNGGNNLDFVYRSLIGRTIAPGRDLGVMAHGRAEKPAARIRPACSRATATTRARRRRAAAVAPWRAGSSSRRSPRAPHRRWRAAGRRRARHERARRSLGLRGRTVFGEGVFFDRVFVNGRRLRRGLEASWAHGPRRSRAST